MPYVVDNLPFLFSADDIDRLANNPKPGKCYRVVNTSTRRSFKVGHCGKGKKGRKFRSHLDGSRRRRRR